MPALASYLRGKGLKVVAEDSTFSAVTVQATVGALETAFAVRLYEYRDRRSGEVFMANDRPTTLPPEALGVLGFDDSVRGAPMGGSAVSASQVRTAYNAQSLVSAGTNGSGQRVAIYAEGGFSTQNIDQFDHDAGLVAPNLTVSVPDLQPGGWLGAIYGWKQGMNGPSHDPSENEAELDIEAVHGMAPGAAIHVYEAANDLGYISFIVGLASFLEGVARDGEQIASISYGSCEGQISPGDLAILAAWFALLTTEQHVSVFASSGDTGKDCYSWTGSGNSRSNSPPVYYQGVNYPASDVSVSGVGGTHLDLTSTGTLNSEQAWDDPSKKNGRVSQALGNGPGAFASGGGTSSFPQPSWQKGLVPGTRARMVPDVAADADPSSGLTITTYAGLGINGSVPAGGTSLSAPLWGGVAAIYDQFAAAHQAPPLGLANEVLYKLEGALDRPLLDVTTAQNGGGDLAGSVAAGWDAATGLGSPNVAALVHDGIALTSAVPTSYTDLHTIDWANATVPADACGTPGPIRLHNGKANATSDRFPGFTTVVVYVAAPVSVGTGISFGDLDGAGHDDAALSVVCDTGGFTGGSTLANILVIYSGVGGVHPISVLHTILPATNQAPYFQPGSIQLSRGQVHAVEAGYAPADPPPAPSLSRNDTWTWDGTRFQVIDSPAPSPPVPTPPLPTSRAPSVRAGHDTPQGAVRGFYDGEFTGNWTTACSYVEPSAQAACTSATSGQPAATGTVTIDAVTILTTQALVEVTGNICNPADSPPCTANNSPSTGMPTGKTDFPTAYAAAITNATTNMSPIPCLQINGKWYLNLG
ncbi:MAG: S53 family peptidase [Actinomycetota bacterium]|nr:S53 family peptidase [Actinomycetota bacterium]